MTMHGKIGRPGSQKTKRALGVQAALEWAFGVEKAQLELPPAKDGAEEGFGFGLEYILLQRAILGCKIDGGQHKMGGYVHADAEVIAATLAGLPDSLGGKRMAISVAELARAGLTPDWMPGAVPRCVPVDIKRNRHGDRAVSVVVGTARALISGKWRIVVSVRCRCGSGVFGLPVPRREIFDAIDLVIRQALEDPCEPRFGVDIVHLGGFDERVSDGSRFSAAD